MKTVPVALSTILLCCHILAEETTANFTCGEIKNTFFGSIFYLFSSPQTYDGTDFYLQTKSNDEGVRIGKHNNNWSALSGEGFDPSRKTYFIAHGYLAHRKKPYIIDMKQKLLDTNSINLIILDWSNGGQTWNYVNAAQITHQVAQDIIKLLKGMKAEVAKLNKPGIELWKNLYFIGHSLGAHISGQAGHLLKQDSFFKVERITGLDPAQPCFTQADQSMKLDKSDADFVDIIHTQTGHGKGVNAFGLQDPIDFYVNGGVMQPECETKSRFYTLMNKMICSHNLANDFYAETAAYSKSSNCKFIGRSWNGSYNDAVRILSEAEKDSPCSDCPEMGLNAINYKTKTGKYLVFTSLEQPYCQLKKADTTQLVKGLGKLNITTMLFPTDTFNHENVVENWISK